LSIKRRLYHGAAVLHPLTHSGLKTAVLQGVSITLLCISYDPDVRPSVRPSICLSVTLTRWHCVKTTQARITKSSPTDSPRTLVFGIKNSSRNSKGYTPSMALNERGVGKIRNFQPITRSISETVQDRTNLLLMTNRKSHTPFDWCQNQRPWMTSNSRYAFCSRKDASFGAHHKKIEWR